MSRFAPTLFLSAALLAGATTAQAALPAEATLYKNPQCGCCDGYARYLEEMGIAVTVIDDQDLGQIKEAAGLPYGLGSCHTVKMGETLAGRDYPSLRLKTVIFPEETHFTVPYALIPHGLRWVFQER